MKGVSFWKSIQKHWLRNLIVWTRIFQNRSWISNLYKFSCLILKFDILKAKKLQLLKIWFRNSSLIKKIVQKLDMKKCIEIKLKFLWICFISLNEKNEKTKKLKKLKKFNVLNEKCFDVVEIIVQYLWVFKRLIEIIILNFQKWKKNFFIKMQNRQLFCQNIKNVFLLKIIDNQKKTK